MLALRGLALALPLTRRASFQLASFHSGRNYGAAPSVSGIRREAAIVSLTGESASALIPVTQAYDPERGSRGGASLRGLTGRKLRSLWILSGASPGREVYHLRDRGSTLSPMEDTLPKNPYFNTDRPVPAE